MIGLGATLLSVLVVTADSDVMIPAPSAATGGLITAAVLVLIMLLIRRPAHRSAPLPAT